jgi:hypothetical protein
MVRDAGLGALDVTLTPAQLEALDTVSALPTAYPNWLQDSGDTVRRPAGANRLRARSGLNRLEAVFAVLSLDG